MIRLTYDNLDALASIYPRGDHDTIFVEYNGLEGVTATIASPATGDFPARQRRFDINSREPRLLSEFIGKTPRQEES